MWPLSSSLSRPHSKACFLLHKKKSQPYGRLDTGIIGGLYDVVWDDNRMPGPYSMDYDVCRTRGDEPAESGESIG